MPRRKIGSDYGWILPTGVILLIGVGAYIAYQKLFGDAGGAGGGPAPLAPGGALSPQSSSTATQQTTLTTDDQLVAFYQAQPQATNPFLSTLYQTNPTGATIVQAQATSLWGDLTTAEKGSGLLSWFKDYPDMSPVLAQFQSTVQNAIDISFVASLCQAATGQTLGDWLFNSFANDQTGTSGVTNMQMLANFVYWAFTLPSD
jgi:hypothetical protein